MSSFFVIEDIELIEEGTSIGLRILSLLLI